MPLGAAWVCMQSDRKQTLSRDQPLKSLPIGLDPAVARAVTHIQEHFAEDLDLGQLAQAAGLSRSVLSERFVAFLGEPPIRYCARWRMHIAANMLRAGKQNTANIAYAVGFNSEAAFNRAFKREFGQPPSAWKKSVELELAYDPHPHRLCVSSTPTGANWLTRHLRNWVEANPDLTVELEPNPRKVEFEQEPFDCAIRAGRIVPTGLHTEHLFRTNFTPMCSPAFLASHPELSQPGHLRDAPRITPNDPWWDAWWKASGTEPPHRTPGAEMGAQVLDGLAALRGQGVALLTPLFWSDELDQGHLLRLSAEEVDGEGDYWLVYPRSRYEWPKIRMFADWLHGLCKSAAAPSAAGVDRTAAPK